MDSKPKAALTTSFGVCVCERVEPGDSEALPLPGQSDSTPEAGG